MFVESYPLIIRCCDEVMLGVASSNCHGTLGSHYLKAVSANQCRQLSIMYIADVLCHQVDHSPGNYIIDNSTDSIIAFDNDNIQTFSPTFSINIGRGCDLINTSKNTRIILDKDVVDNLLCLSLRNVYIDCKRYLTNVQMFGLFIRIIRLKYHISRLVDSMNIVLVSKPEWPSVFWGIDDYQCIPYLAELIKRN